MANLNAVVKVEKDVEAWDGRVGVNSIWYTLQGEGPLTGTPAVFVRLQGCCLNCSWCDTLYTEGERMSIQQVVDEVKNAFIDGSHIGSLSLGNELLPHPLVVITGGEPFVQIGMPRLVKYLVHAGYRVQIETSGSAWQPEFKTVAHIADVHNLRVQVVCSPKTGKVNKHLSHYVTAWKYVVKAGEVDEDDGLPNTSPETGRPLMLARPPIRKPNVYISPCDEYDEVKNAANVKEAVRVVMQYGYKLSLQVHKIVGVD